MTCAGCGHANGEKARFCESCGSPLSPRCTSCGEELSDRARFCSSCGTPVADGAGATAALKVISVVFSDLVGSTALQETLEPESVRRVMARFYEAMQGVVNRHGGAIQKFIGDAVVAVFGAPAVGEDDALRAVRCAAAMAKELAALNDEFEAAWGVRLEIRTGVNTGELAVSDEGIFVGDTMNTAARLEQAAAAGEVLVGEATWRLIRHETELEELAPLSLKGKTAAVRVWRLLGTETRGAAAAAAPLVGRDRELARLRVALDAAIDARACRLVSIIGSPGLGKSRLAAEFAQAIDGEATVLDGHCELSGEGITFLPVAEVLRGAASIGEADLPEQVIAKLAAIVEDVPDGDRVAAGAASLLGAGSPTAPEETFWAVRTVFESLGRKRPLMIVLDDVHWGQPMFLDLIEHLVEWVRDAAILLVALARPELREVREVLAAAGRRAVDVIELDALQPEQSREIVGGLLGQVELPDQLLAKILETTGGNPLFIGELLRMLVDEGLLERAGEVWVFAGNAETIQVPPTIQALLTARIERLRAGERSVVERAAVIGKQFYRGAVAELVAPPVRSGIDGHLETLRRKDIVEPEGTYWIDEPVYRFHHVLIRDAAYHLLLKEARAELHERFADWLEDKAGELVGEHEEVIAYHLEQAHEYRRQLGPLDGRGTALGSRAAQHLASAGRRALAREDLAAAANLLQRALDRKAEVAEEEIRWDLADALLSAGDTAATHAVVERLKGPRGDVLASQLAVLTGTDVLEDVVERVTAATTALAALGDDRGEAKGHHVAAQVQAQLGQVADVEASLDRALLAARKADDRRRITAVLAAAPRAALWGPSPVMRASGRCLDVVRILRMSSGNRHVEPVALRCQAVLEAMRGRSDAAREILAGGRATLEELGLTFELHELGMHAGIVELLDGKPGDAEGLLRAARDGFATLGASVSAAASAALLARALADQRRDDEAIAETEYAEEHAGGDLKTTITWLGVRAEALVRRDRTEDALGLARRAVALADPTDALADKADAYLALARVCRESGRSEEAREAAAAARALYAAKDHAIGVRWAGELASGPARSDPADVTPVTTTAAAVDEPELTAFAARFGAVMAVHDVEGLAALCAPGWVLIDHRQLTRDMHDDVRSWISPIFEGSLDIRLDVDEVIAAAPGVVALRTAWRGHSSDGGGEFELPVGNVLAIRGGLLERAEVFDVDAETSMRACFEDLRGRMLLGDRPPERWWRTFVEAFARQDASWLGDLYAEDYVQVDRRALAWEDVHGREAAVHLLESAWRIAADVRCVIDQVLACDDERIAVRCRFAGTALDGAGPMEIALGYAGVVNDAIAVRGEQFDPLDRDGMLARYRELGGALGARAVRPPERLLREYFRRFEARDVEALSQLVTDDVFTAEHRRIRFGAGQGRERFARTLASIIAVTADWHITIEEVIASDERTIVAQVAYRGTSSQYHVGATEVIIGEVYALRDGVFCSIDLYEPDDRAAMIARYVELGGGLGQLGDTEPERLCAEFARCHARRDLDGMLELTDDDCRWIDRRGLAWEPTVGRDGVAAVTVSAWHDIGHIRVEFDEVLAVSDRVLAVRFRWVGQDGRGGAFELPAGQVSVYENGRCISVDQYDADDREAMLARFRELDGSRSVLGDRASERVLAELQAVLNGRDYRRLAELISQDAYIVDHRPLGYDDVRGRDQCVRDLRTVYDASPDVHLDFDEVLAADDRVAVTWLAVRGRGVKAGELETAYLAVSLIEDGLLVGLDYYPTDDCRTAITRYAELGGGGGLLGDRPPEEFYRRWLPLSAAADVDALTNLVAEDFVRIDHRSLGWEPLHGRDANVALWSSAYEGIAHLRMEIDEVLACDERVIALRFTWHGVAIGGPGEFEVGVGQVNVIEDGIWRSCDQYAPEDREAMMLRFAEHRR